MNNGFDLMSISIVAFFHQHSSSSQGGGGGGGGGLGWGPLVENVKFENIEVEIPE
jgi:hypothetical protein